MKATVRVAARSSTVALGLALAVTGCGTIEGRSPDAGAGRPATVAGAPEKPGSAEAAKGLLAAKQATDMATLASRVEAPLAMARQAKAASDWQTCARRAAEAIRLLEKGGRGPADPAHSQATALQAEAEAHLAPALTIVAEAGGEEVAAQVCDGTNNWTTPATLKLDPRQSYNFTVAVQSSQTIPPSQSKYYRFASVSVTADWQGPRTQRVVLEEQKKLVADAPWQNTLGMEFVPVPGTEVQFCKWETRVQDYEAFVKARGVPWHKPSFGKGFKPGPTHPAVNVSWAEATAFCEWLTATERNMGLIASHQSYRLPRDWEWSVAVGLNEPRSGSPQDKDSKIEGVYPWGTRWPPPRGAGNYGPSWRADDFPYTSPVGSFAANRFGLYDLGGNAWEWCEESYNGQSGDRVARGGSAYFFAPRSLLSSYRLNYGPDFSNDLYGFRCVLVVSARGWQQTLPYQERDDPRLRAF